MSEILLVNPRKRRKHKRARSPAQKAAFRKMLAARGRSVNPRRRRRRKHGRVAHAVSRVAGRIHRRYRNPIRHHRRRRHSNPVGNIGAFLKSTLMPSAIGAGGAILTDIAFGFISPYIPASINTPTIKPVLQVGTAIGLGFLVGKVAGRRNGELVAAGGIVVALYNLIKPMVQSMLPSVPMGYYSPAQFQPNDAGQQGDMGYYQETGVGYYQHVA